MSQRGDWLRIDYRPAIADLPPEPVVRRVPAGSMVLDIGCNKGSNAFFLAERGFRVIGIDVNRAAIREARRRAEDKGAGGELEFRTGDILDEPFEERFDVVLLIRVLTCFAGETEWNALLRRAGELLEPRGYLYLHDFLVSPDVEAYRIRYEAGVSLGWRTGNFPVDDANGKRLFIAHHHSEEEVARIMDGYERLSYRVHESLSLHGNRCRMFEFLGRKQG